MMPSCASFAATELRRSMIWPRRSGHRGERSCAISALCAIRASSSIPKAGAVAVCSLTHNRFRPPRAYQWPRCLPFSSALRLCERLIACHFPTSQMPGWLAKIEKALPPDKVRDLRRLLDCLHIGQLSPQQDISDLGPIDPALLPAFETAFLQQRHLRFQYCDAQGTETSREIEPQAMLILSPLWYLVAWDPSREDFRHFRMDRISEPRSINGAQFRRRHVPFEDDVCPFRDLPR